MNSADAELLHLADRIFDELCLREEGFYYEEIYMALEYLIGRPADGIKRRLDELDATIINPPL